MGVVPLTMYSWCPCPTFITSTNTLKGRVYPFILYSDITFERLLPGGMSVARHTTQNDADFSMQRQRKRYQLYIITIITLSPSLPETKPDVRFPVARRLQCTTQLPSQPRRGRHKPHTLQPHAALTLPAPPAPTAAAERRTARPQPRLANRASSSSSASAASPPLSGPRPGAPCSECCLPISSLYWSPPPGAPSSLPSRAVSFPLSRAAWRSELGTRTRTQSHIERRSTRTRTGRERLGLICVVRTIVNNLFLFLVQVAR